MDLLRFIDANPDKYQYDFQKKLGCHNIIAEPATITNFNQISFDRIPSDTFKAITAQIKPVMEQLGY